MYQILSTWQNHEEIGNILNLSSRTVESYIESVKDKTGYNFKSQIIDLFWSIQNI